MCGRLLDADLAGLVRNKMVATNEKFRKKSPNKLIQVHNVEGNVCNEQSTSAQKLI